MPERKYELSNSEWLIMKAVWKYEPCAAPDVQEALHDSTRWTYSTVKTIMDRMVQKGLLTTERIRNLMLYRSAIMESEAQRGEVFRTLKRAFNGALTPMMQFLLDKHHLSEEELDRLAALINAKRRKVAPSKKSKTG